MSKSRKFLPVSFLYWLYSGRWRPAWRNSHTGVASVSSPLATRTIRSFLGFWFVTLRVAAAVAGAACATTVLHTLPSTGAVSFGTSHHRKLHS
jgi:hypothetical protein